MKTALALMVLAFAIAVLKGMLGAPTIDGITLLVFVLVLGSLAAYYRWSTAPRRDR